MILHFTGLGTTSLTIKKQYGLCRRTSNEGGLGEGGEAGGGGGGRGCGGTGEGGGGRREHSGTSRSISSEQDQSDDAASSISDEWTPTVDGANAKKTGR